VARSVGPAPRRLMSGNDRDQAVSEAVARVLAQRRGGGEVHVTDEPDKQDRTRPAVDLIARDDQGSWALEHTRIESFPDQLLDDRQLLDLLEPLTSELRGSVGVPGIFHLAVAPRAVAGATPARDIRAALASWVRKHAPTLAVGSPLTAPHHTITEAPPGVPFEVTLTRWPGPNRGDVRLMRNVPADLEDQRVTRLTKALDDKITKLLAASDGDITSVLILEDTDVALANLGLIVQALSTAAEGQSRLPDVIVLVETVPETPAASTAIVVKEGERWWPSFPYDRWPLDVGGECDAST
jgi:hypothetical protein